MKIPWNFRKDTKTMWKEVTRLKIIEQSTWEGKNPKKSHWKFPEISMKISRKIPRNFAESSGKFKVKIPPLEMWPTVTTANSIAINYVVSVQLKATVEKLTVEIPLTVSTFPPLIPLNGNFNLKV